MNSHVSGHKPEYYDERMATNLRHMFFAMQAVAPGMIDVGGEKVWAGLRWVDNGNLKES